MTTYEYIYSGFALAWLVFAVGGALLRRWLLRGTLPHQAIIIPEREPEQTWHVAGPGILENEAVPPMRVEVLPGETPGDTFSRIGAVPFSNARYTPLHGDAE